MDILHRVAVVIDERDHVVLVAKFALGHLAGIRLRRSMDFNNDVVNFTQYRSLRSDLPVSRFTSDSTLRGSRRAGCTVMTFG